MSIDILSVIILGVAALVVGITAAYVLLFRSKSLAIGDSITLKKPLVIDGDTLFYNKVKYRLHGIDAPESGQRDGPKSTEYLRKIIGRSALRAEIMDIDKYGRRVVRIFAKDIDLCRAMVINGYALAYFHPDYRPDQVIAKRAKRGLWAKGDIENPAAWRRAHTSGKFSLIWAFPGF